VLKRLFYLTLNDLSAAPYPEVTLPALIRDGWAVTLAGPGASNSAYRASLPYPVEKVIDLPRAGKMRAEGSFLREILQARFGSFDVLYLNSIYSAVRGGIYLSGPKFGKRIIYHSPDYYCPMTYPWRFRMEGRTARKSDLYINNEFHRGYITQVMHHVQCPVIIAPPNLPLAWPRPKKSAETRNVMAGGRDDAFVLMLHGGWSPLRMVTQLWQGLAQLPDRFRLVMTGGHTKGEDSDRLLAELGISDRVLRLPKLPFNEMLGYTVNADAGVLIYSNNDLGNFFTAPGRMTEYLICGIPVLGSNHTGIENLVMRYDLGKTTDATNPAAIAKSIEKLAAAIDEGSYSSVRMQQAFEERFAFDHWEPLVVEAMNAVLSARSAKTIVPPTFPWMPRP
jgi:glycosyltransferase involved in cell wall biosynthesis